MLGPSGSGKTTTLLMLAGFEVPTHGRILLDGRPIDNMPPHKRDIGMVFQNYALFPHMTVEENLAFPLQVRKVAQGGDRDPDQAGARDGPARPLWQAPAGPAFRRAAAARGAGPRAGLRSQAGADGRAAGRARQAAARADAARDQAYPRGSRRHRRLCHPRPERGAHHVGPHRGLQRRGDPAAGQARRSLRAARQCLRRPVHRREQPAARPGDGDERHDLPGRRFPAAAPSGRWRSMSMPSARRPRCRCGRSG